MNHLIHDQSERVNTPELSLWEVPPTACGIVSRRVIDCPLVNSLSGNSGGLEWRYSHQKAYVDLRRCYFYMKLSVKSADGKNLIVDDKEAQVAFINFIGATLFKKLQLFINGKLVEESGAVNHAYRAFLETELFNSAHTKASLDSAGYSQDATPDTADGSSFKLRTSWIKGTGTLEVSCPIHLALFRQSKLLLNFLDMKVVATLNDSAFVLEAPNTDAKVEGLSFKVNDIRLKIHECEVADSAMLAIENMLREKPARYPVTSIQMRSFYITKNRLAAPEHRFINSTIPKLVVLGLVDATRYNGDIRKSPFVFQPFNVSEATLTVAGRTIPAKMALDWDNSKWLDAYTQFQEGLGVIHEGNTIGVTREMFKNCFALHVFEVASFLHSNALSLLTLGTTSVSISFQKPLTTDCYAVLFSVFDDIIEIDTNRDVRMNSLI